MTHRDFKPQWKPEIALGHILQMLVIIVAVVVWGVRQESAIERNAQRISYQDEAIKRVDHRIDREMARTAASLEEIKQSVLRLNEKLDRMLSPNGFK